MPLILALGRQRQVDLCEFEANLVYSVSSNLQYSGGKGRWICLFQASLVYKEWDAVFVRFWFFCLFVCFS